MVSLAIIAGCWIDVVINGSGEGRVFTASGTINCSTTNPEQADCSESYSAAGEETFKAQPDPGYRFTGWNMGHCAGVGDCYVPWSQDDYNNNSNATVTVEATFTPVNPTPASVTYTYNAQGQRVAKTANGVTVSFP